MNSDVTLTNQATHQEKRRYEKSAEQLDGGPIRRTKLNYLTLTMLLQATIIKISQRLTKEKLLRRSYAIWGI